MCDKTSEYISDITDSDNISDCCGVNIISEDICSCCYEHCGITEEENE